MLDRLKNLFRQPKVKSQIQETTEQTYAYEFDEELISPSALKVVRRLQDAGYSAYLVGGCIRDLLLEGHPKDFDVATDATPEDTRALFRNSRIIGRRFKIVHVRYGREIIEVTTFRAHHEDSSCQKQAKQSQQGMLLRDNVFGDIESDAIRRDFTVNALYYDPRDKQILDFTNGLEDIKRRRLKIIGDAEARYREDPVRMLRAVRFSAKLGFQIDQDSGEPINRLAPLLAEIPSARLFEEVLKLLLSGSATATLHLLREKQLFTYLFPGTERALRDDGEFELKFVNQAVINTDKRLRQNKRVTPAFIYAAFLWLPLQEAIKKLMAENKLPIQDAMQQAAHGVVGEQLASTSIPKRFSIPMREIWSLQLRLPQREGRKAFNMMEHPRFRAAYDFALLREEAGEDLNGLGAWWTRFQDASEDQRVKMTQEFKGRRKRRSRRKPNTKKPDAPQ